MSIHQGKVKSVLSGDTVILTAVHNPRSERILSLAYVTAPRLKREGDEPYAVESRDFIRRHLVGKVIQFRILYTAPGAAKRDYGIITLQDGRQLPDLSVAEGYLKLRDDAGRREESEENTALVEKLRALEAHAKADEKGLWDADIERINTSYELPSAQDFLDSHKGQELDGVVEKVLSGDRLIVRLNETPTQHVQTMLLVAGMRAPGTKRVNTTEGTEQPAEPFGEEAHEFVESRLLQRNVKVTPLGVSPQGALVGSIKHPNGDIAVFVLNAGLARCMDFHSTMLGESMLLLRHAEKHAKDNRLGLFQNMAAPRAGGKETEVVVSRVQSADTIFVRYPDGTEKRINLSSVRQPKPSDPKQSPFSADAKEFIRRKLIGKHVKVSVDGKRPATEGFEEREMATVVYSHKNVALSLVEEGYASVLRHRMDDTDRSPIYDELLIAEETAQSEGKGFWGSRTPETKQLVDYSESLEKAKRLFTLLSRQKRVPAIVDYVKSGSRFTLLIPRENAKLTFVLSGINAPKSARTANEQSEPFGREAHDLANKRLQQRDVEIDVEDTDKVGGFIGKLYVNRENFAKILLEEGYASVRGYSAEKSGNAAELNAAEQKAKEGHKGLWVDYDPSQEQSEANGDESAPVNSSNGDDAAPAQAAPSRDYRDVLITHIDEQCRLKFQQISPSTTGALAALMTAFRNFHASPSASTSAALPNPPKAGEYVAARFSEDGDWYRARIRRNDRDAKTAEVVYVDYGNSESVPWTSLRALSQQQFTPQALRPQALDAALSFVQFPLANSQYLADSREYMLGRLVHSGRQLVARVDFNDAKENSLCVSLFDPQDGKGMEPENSVNTELVEEGVAMVSRKPRRWELAQAATMGFLKGRESVAGNERRGMWEYGDPTED